MYSPPSDPAVEQQMRTHQHRAAKALAADVEPGAEFWGWAGRTLGAPVRTAAGEAAWLRLISAPEDKASGKLWDGAATAQQALGDLDGYRPALLAIHDEADNGTAYRAELSVRVREPLLSDDPVLQHEPDIPLGWWADLMHALQTLAAATTDRIAVRTPYMDRAIPAFIGIPAPAAPHWAPAHGDLHWANLTTPLQLLDWESWGLAPAGFDGATLYAYSLLQPLTTARIRAAFPVLGTPAGLAAEATVCAMLLQTVDRGDNLPLAEELQKWAADLGSRASQ
ncbi:hypothetical protein AB0G32_14030 [Streptomyces sp. NPDC023723]|uniref:hypothetical protein n=1 Tax=Streptomyces sp. NPDC023723 TaxID=3154323 RepID=UPI0033F4DD7C